MFAIKVEIRDVTAETFVFTGLSETAAASLDGFFGGLRPG